MWSYCTVSSDGVLNPAGVRFGSAEIYNIGELLCEALCEVLCEVLC